MSEGGLRVEQVSFRYGTRAVLNDVSFTARAGEFVAVVGANGAGKSTLLDVLSGIKQPSAGRIWIGGRPQAGHSALELSRSLSHLPQSVHADLPFTAGQVVAMGRYPHTDRWFESDEDHRMIDAAMDRTGCRQHAERAFASLSGGERQRVLLAACLAQDAPILLLDEPSTFLDIEAQLECFSLLRDVAAAGRLAIAVTHDLNLALAHASRLLLLEDGRLTRQITVRDAAADASWLKAFSPRLRMGTTPAGAPLVWY